MRMALQDCLAAEGHKVLLAADGLAGVEKAVSEKPDLLLLDVMMPKLDGFAVCRELRRVALECPILLLTAKSQIGDRVAGLDAGADDYLVKPFSSEELLARVRALLRRHKRTSSKNAVLKLGGVRIDLGRQTADKEGAPLHLTAKEFAMLRLLHDRAGEPVSREQFLDAVWGYASFPTTRTIDNHIASLRGKIEADPERPQWLLTVHGIGYRFCPPEFANP